MDDRPQIAIVGAGLIGRAWAYVFARGGLTVRAWDPDAAVRDDLDAQMQAMVREAGGPADLTGRIRAVATLEEALVGAALAQENGPERAETKRELYTRMDAIADRETVLASSSSAIPASVFSSGLPGADRCLVAHPVNPPHLVPVVELCPSSETAPATMDRAEAIYRAVGQVPVRLTCEVEGFVLNRLQAVLLAESLRLVQDGVCTVQGLDDTIKHGLGRRWAFMGPLETISLNAPEGVADYMRRYGPTLARLADDSARGEAFNDSAAHIVAVAFPDTATPAAVRARTAWRDGELAALDAHLRSRASKD
ncbi:3-hydroxyacyl-CoA dehydrogenase [uncultured Paracoccus sp.]|uniref:3-hydroxyacyl-CoA dehydrogenase n=1 Tax=uncultured Paracoccus sp. TaxID=189685 RepID=UPI00262D9371|nr:3-hydroxyacyl-CoA dehydrogenase [uncultured Paracoccus sp.]